MKLVADMLGDTIQGWEAEGSVYIDNEIFSYSDHTTTTGGIWEKTIAYFAIRL